MTVPRPTHTELAQIAEQLGLHVSDDELDDFHEILQATWEAYDLVDDIEPAVSGAPDTRREFSRPSREEDRLNVWSCRTDITGNGAGKLKGKAGYGWACSAKVSDGAS